MRASLVEWCPAPTAALDSWLSRRTCRGCPVLFVACLAELFLLLDFPFICTASVRGIFFCSPYYFILLSVNIAMMILNFFTRRLLIVLARTHSVRSKPYSYQKKISPPQQGRINWLVSLLTTITKKTDFKKDSLFLRIMMLYVQWSSFTSLHNYWRFSNEIMWIQLHCVILFCARSKCQ